MVQDWDKWQAGCCEHGPTGANRMETCSVLCKNKETASAATATYIQLQHCNIWLVQVHN
jgi:hypothetical protein